MGTQKNCLIEMVLLSTHNICFGGEIKKLIFSNALLFGDFVTLVLTIFISIDKYIRVQGFNGTGSDSFVTLFTDY